jgi:predicted transcriptional regulator
MERYLSILESLISQPLKFKKISYKANIKSQVLKKHLEFLLLHRLIKENSFEKEGIAYSITDIGLAVLKILQAKKYSEKIYQNILRMHMDKQGDPLQLQVA